MRQLGAYHIPEKAFRYGVGREDERAITVWREQMREVASQLLALMTNQMRFERIFGIHGTAPDYTGFPNTKIQRLTGLISP